MYRAFVAIIGTIAVCITTYCIGKSECILALAFVCLMTYITPATEEEDIDARRY